ncbi:hypothetical protein Dsin_029667 [Dipteronia sinensis]|uniref:Pentatricopeptide repeat-containing protein n=1 Tax=Dipteronia sinensis TaxID=43782 RepID=A0AAE0DVQ1_9ROSI|nr:hypothetical protein Dsin_029667 [Dipteronia sinensis]
MLAKHKFMKLFRCHHSQKNLKIKPLRHLICNPFCTATESPELPSWIKSSDTQKPGEDFVIPSLASWVESYKLHDQTRLASNILSEKTETDIDRFSKILKNRYPSPDGVVQALNGSCLSASTGLVEQILRRFSNDLVSALGGVQLGKNTNRRLARGGKYDEAVEAFRGLDKFGVTKDAMAMNLLIDALAKENSVEHAYEVFCEFKELYTIEY